MEVLTHHTVVEVHGRSAVSSLTVAPSAALGSHRTFACDLVAVSGGWSPVVHLHAQSGGRPRYDSRIAAFLPGPPVQAERSAGAAAGCQGIAACIRDGSTAATEAMRELGNPVSPGPAAEFPPWSYAIEPVWELPGTRAGTRAFVDFGHDVTAADIRLALRENYDSVELVKRYTTSGMALDQGKLSNVNTIGIIAAERSCSPGEIGTTTFRPLYRPMSFGVWAGHDRGEVIIPARRTPITPWFENAGAEFNEAGEGFRRPFRIPRPGESAQAAVEREALAVRNAAGIYDGTPLGKFELHGRDVVTLLNRVYTNRWDSLPIGMGRFGWMLHEDGRLFDDGVTFRLGPEHYWMTTGSSTASAVHAHLERLLQCEWPELAVFVTPVTEQWANMCLCGPRAREILESAGTDIDLHAASFPFMGIRLGRVAGFEVRMARVSYTGELSFELNVRARDGLALWKALLASGERFGITPVGSDAILLLRLEKGFIAAWAEGDGYVTPEDAGLGWNINEAKGDFIGKRSLARDRHVGGPRPQIVGLLPLDARFVPCDGAPLTEEAIGEESDRMIGHVTAAGYSPNLRRSIALAQLANGRTRIGERIAIFADGRAHAALVSPPVFFDPEGRRMRS
jgi:sarcosine oxidase subunit alpha